MMTNHHHTTNLSNCGNELLKCIEDLKRKRDEISKQIMVVGKHKNTGMVRRVKKKPQCFLLEGRMHISLHEVYNVTV